MGQILCNVILERKGGRNLPESCISEVQRTSTVENFVVEYREVKCELETDEMCGWRLRDGNIIRLSNGIVKSLLGKMACTVRTVENFIVEYREVKCELETDGMCGRQLRSNIGERERGSVANKRQHTN